MARGSFIAFLKEKEEKASICTTTRANAEKTLSPGNEGSGRFRYTPLYTF
jgi:hypothetical protein